MGLTFTGGMDLSGLTGVVIAPVVTTNLLISLDAGNSSSYSGTGTTWYDLSGNGNNGTLTNGPVYTSGTSGYFTFDGTNDYVNMGTVNLQRNFTLEIWAYITADNSGMFGQGTTSANSGLHIVCSYTAASRGMVFGMYANDLDTPSYSGKNAWHQFCFTYNSSTYLKQFYADGSIVNSGTGSAYSGSGQFNIGGAYSGPSTYWTGGRIAIARMYTAVLTASEVLQNFNAVRPRYT